MAPNPILIPKIRRASPAEQQKTLRISTPLLFGAFVALLASLFRWSRRWLISGSPILTFLLLLGASKGHRVLPVIPLWTLLPIINLSYAVASTSWLLYAFFVGSCYPSIFLVCLFQFDWAANLARRRLRQVLKQVQFVNDNVALFDIPALEIDTEVDGLMVIRGITLSLSRLTLVAHGVEVGIKLSDDMELALQTEKVTVYLFRRVEVDDVYANIKGGEFEMTFGNLDARINANDPDGDPLMISDSALLRRATTHGDTSRPPMVKMKSRMTHGVNLQDMPAQEGLGLVTAMSPDNTAADKSYQNTLKWIEQTNMISQCRQDVIKAAGDTLTTGNISNEKDMRAAISTRLHSKTTIPHPPRHSIRVTSLQTMSPPRVRAFMHRLPMLYRLLLLPLSYFHPVSINSITAAGSGKWITSQLRTNIFKNYGDESSEVRKLERRVMAWLSDANFVFELDKVLALGQVPFLTDYDIVCYLKTEDVMAYRTPLGEEVQLTQVVRVGGADATFSIPYFLLPHHEHLLPSIPTQEIEEEVKKDVMDADSKPKAVQKERELEQTQKDEANVVMSVHARLPMCCDQELLNFVAALVKATKVVELEQAHSVADEEVGSGVREFAKSLNKNMRDGMKKAMVDGIVNDRWIAKMVGKITKQLETAQGEAGYTGNIPVLLEKYRLPAGHQEASKLLP